MGQGLNEWSLRSLLTASLGFCVALGAPLPSLLDLSLLVPSLSHSGATSSEDVPGVSFTLFSVYSNFPKISVAGNLKSRGALTK